MIKRYLIILFALLGFIFFGSLAIPQKVNACGACECGASCIANECNNWCCLWPYAPACDGGSYCSVSCGGGVLVCITCAGTQWNTSTPCNTQCCPVNGGWGAWSGWSNSAGYSDGAGGTCSATCGTGIQTRTRTCSNPAPSCGGANCVGSSSEQRNCNTQSCNNAPNAPTISSPTTGSIKGITFAISLAATDTESDYLRYKIEIATDAGFSTIVQTLDQTSSQIGWSGQNTQTSTAYTSGSTATYTIQTPLSNSIPYHIRAYAKDPGGSNTWSTNSTAISITTGMPNATPNGTTSVTGRFGYARSFNGTSDFISIGNNGLGSMSTSFTIEAWVKTTSVAQQTIISEYQGGVCQDGRFYIQALSGYPILDNGNGTVNTGIVIVNDGVWHHVAYVYNSSMAKGTMYVDGIPGTDTTAAAWRNTCTGTDTRIGAEVGANYFSGTLDNIRVYSIPISDVKMKQLYYNGFVSGCTTGSGYTVESACPVCPRSASEVDDGNCGKKYCAAC